MEKQRVLELQTLTAGAQLGVHVKTSISSTKDKVEMAIHPAGVYIAGDAGHFIIPWSNVRSLRVEAPKAAETDPSRNGKR